MINGLNVLAIIPARGGSKGVPLKNLREVGGVPIVELAAQVASKVNYIDRIVVSTDHDRIADAALKGGADSPFRRPEELCGDRISDLQVLTHAALEMENIDDKKYHIIIMLQPTSPLRTKENIIDAIKLLIDCDFDSVWTVSETDSKFHPLKQLTINKGIIDFHNDEGKSIIARQQLKPVYHRNGIAYIIKRETLINGKSIMGNKPGALLIPGNHISIDTEYDFELINYILSK